jgi:hypothetical protein
MPKAGGKLVGDAAPVESFPPDPLSETFCVLKEELK